MGKRILVVDDEPANLVLMEALLEPFNAQVTLAHSGAEGLAALDQHPYDLALLDLMMPGMNGLELIRRIRARTDRPRFPVVLVTAAYDRAARLDGFEAGADEFLEKPIDRPLLLTRVRTLLQLQEAQETLEERARALEELHRARRELVNLIVHDLKNPLSVIHTNLRYVQGVARPGTPPYVESLEDATAACARMTGLVMDILSVERMELSQLPLRREKVNVGALVSEVARSHQRELELSQLQLSSTIGDANVRADPELIRRVVENLMENALQHTPPRGTIDLCVEPGNEVAVVVSNTGHPIAAAIRDQIFAKYVSGEESPRKRFGLGLYFCQRVALAHQGTISVVDRAGWPVSFRFALPSA